MIQTGKTKVLGEKYYTVLVVDEWMGGAMMEWHRQGKTEVVGEK